MGAGDDSDGGAYSTLEARSRHESARSRRKLDARRHLTKSAREKASTMNDQVFLNGAPVVGFGATDSGLELTLWFSPIIGYVGGSILGYFAAGGFSDTRRSAAIGTAIGGAAGAVIAPTVVGSIRRSTR